MLLFAVLGIDASHSLLYLLLVLMPLTAGCCIASMLQLFQVRHDDASQPGGLPLRGHPPGHILASHHSPYWVAVQ